MAIINGPHQWTSGTHKFYGWLVKDASSNLEASTLFGNNLLANANANNKNYTVAAFNNTTQTLSIPTTDMSNAANKQFDFLYSNIVTSKPKNEPVNLEFSHLFAA